MRISPDFQPVEECHETSRADSFRFTAGLHNFRVSPA